MLNAPNNQYGPMIPAQQPQQQPAAATQLPQEQGQQPAQGGIYNYPVSSCYTPQTSDFNGVKLIINNPQGYAAAGGAPVAQPAVSTIPANYYVPGQPINFPQQPGYMPQPAQTPEPMVKTEPAQNKPEIQEPTEELPGVKVQSFTAGLNSNDINVQAQTMNEICDAAKSDDKIAAALQSNEIYDALINIVNKDASGLQGPTDEILAKRQELLNKATTPEQQAEAFAQTMTEQEAFIMHQREALFTIAVLQNAIIKLGESQNKEVQLHTVPAIDTIVETVKSNPEPIMRAGAIQALSHIARPNFKPELEQIFTIAASDSDPGVQEIANAANEQLAKI
ncbi:hypothetical protein IKQ26_02420 [bacterium]|nr:hypothetical protein [bacterium]